MTRAVNVRWLFAGAGACDLTTGLLLLTVPGVALALMQIPTVAAGEIFLRWIGVFVGAIGSFYLLPFLVGVGERAATARAVLLMTLLARGAVATFVVTAVATGALAAAWLTVAVVDGTLAVGQWWLLRQGSTGWEAA